MPHQCTNCERVFPDGSKEMLSGCPDCGGNKFQFKPDSSTPTPTLGDDGADGADGADDADDAEVSADPPSSRSAQADDASRPDPSQSPSSGTSADPSQSPSSGTSADPSQTPNGTTSDPADGTVTSGPSTGRAPSAPDPAPDTDADYIEAESDPSVVEEDTAQADARRDVVTRDELDDEEEGGDGRGRRTLEDERARDGGVPEADEEGDGDADGGRDGHLQDARDADLGERGAVVGVGELDAEDQEHDGDGGVADERDGRHRGALRGRDDAQPAGEDAGDDGVDERDLERAFHPAEAVGAAASLGDVEAAGVE